MKITLLLVALICVFAAPAPVGGFELTGVPDVPDNAENYAFWLEFINDGFGLAFVDEWDDGRSFGLYAGSLLFSRLIVNFNYSALTDRGEAGGTPTRIDVADVGVGARITRGEWGAFFADLSGGLGLRFTGDILGKTIQEGWHALMFVERPIPETYEGPGSVVTYGYLEGGVGVTRPVRFTVTSTNLLLLSGVFSFSLEWMLEKRWEYSSAWISLEYFDTIGKSGYSSVDFVADRERGMWANAGMLAGRLYFESSYNLYTRISYGTLGWRSSLGNEPRGGGGSGEVRDSGIPGKGLVGENEGTQALEIGKPLGFTSYIFQARFAPSEFFERGIFLERSKILFEWQTGWDGNRPGAVEAERYQQFLLGWESSLLKPRRGFWANPYLYAGLGVRTETLYTVLLERSPPSLLEGAGIVQAGAGVRVQIPSPFQRDDRRYHWGVGFSGNVVLPLTGKEGFGVTGYLSLRIFTAIL
jgi:hypothetical protein